jgi:superfamily II DNA helicase RecQ
MVAEENITEEVKHKLKEVFGYSHFRGIQESIILNILQKDM